MNLLAQLEYCCYLICCTLFAFVGSGSAFANPTISTAAERPQPAIFEGKLKGYQLKVRIVLYMHVIYVIRKYIRVDSDPENQKKMIESWGIRKVTEYKWKLKLFFSYVRRSLKARFFS